MREDEIDRLKTFCEGNHECKCFDARYTSIPIYMPFEPQVPKSYNRRLHDAKVLENAQRLKNIEEREHNSVTLLDGGVTHWMPLPKPPEE